MKTSLYRHYDKDGALLYVGVSLSTLQRLGQHAEHSHWFSSIERITIEHFQSRESALEAERQAIQNETPFYNVRHNDERQLSKTPHAARAQFDLRERVVNFRPVYTIDTAAEALGLTKRLISRWVRMGVLGHFTVPRRNGVPQIFISGWQLIECIEALSYKPDDQPEQT